MEWKPIELAEEYKSSGKPFLAICTHDADIKFISPTEISIYAAHCMLTDRVTDGPHVLVWGGSLEGGWGADQYQIPSWWFRYGSDFKEVANPTLWCPIPDEVALQFAGISIQYQNFYSH